jgi:hypothetical protein
MKVNFYLKEEESDKIEEEYITISIVRKGKNRHQVTNAKPLENLSAIEQQNIKNVISLLEKYSGETEGAKDLVYGL